MTSRRGFLGRVLVAALGTLAVVYVPGKPWDVPIPDVWREYRERFYFIGETGLFEAVNGAVWKISTRWRQSEWSTFDSDFKDAVLEAVKA